MGLILFLARREAEGALPTDVQGVLKTYCFDCHDDTTAKGKFSMESLPTDFADPTVMNRWIRVQDRLLTREMPPEKKPQPTESERAATTQWLSSTLQHVSREQQLREGRSGLRRLNRIEYENTLCDLFGVRIALQELLPEDTASSGFDTVGAGLGFSSQHLLRYQEAASRAIEAVCPRGPSNSVLQRITGRQWFQQRRAEGHDKAELLLETGAQVEGQAVLLYAQTEYHSMLELQAGLPRVPGRYRIRISASARNSGGQPIAVLFYLAGYDVAQDHELKRIITVRDALPGLARIIEVEVEVPHDSERWAGHPIAIKGWSLPRQPQPGALEANRFLGVKPSFSGPALAIDWVELEGPLDPSPGLGYRRLFGDLPLANPGMQEERRRGRAPSEDAIQRRSRTDGPLVPLQPVSTSPREDAARLIRSFLPLAFRGPVEEELASTFVGFAHDRLAQGYDFVEAMKAAYRNVLCSPHFLLRMEKPGTLDNWALAVRLGYFLWSSGPDERLLAAAARGELIRPEALHAEVERMLSDPKASRFVENFTGQWLDLRRLYATKPDLMYPEFDDALLWSMPLESTGFFKEVLTRNGSLLEFVRSDWTWLNTRLAQHYGIPGISNWEFRRVSLPPGTHRGGVITHAAVLKVTANGTTTSPVLRGKWMLEQILGMPPSPPPADVPALEPDIRGAITIRQQLEKHRALPACAGCHRLIDPPGFALETFDVIGGWRDWYRSHDERAKRTLIENYPGLKAQRGPDVEKGYRTAEGRTFADVDDYRRILLEDSDQLARSLVRKLIVYATGADLQYADREVVESLVKDLRVGGFGFRSAVQAVVASRMFREK